MDCYFEAPNYFRAFALSAFADFAVGCIDDHTNLHLLPQPPSCAVAGEEFSARSVFPFLMEGARVSASLRKPNAFTVR